MAFTSTASRGVDMPQWDQLAFAPQIVQNACAMGYDGYRFIYTAYQYGTTPSASGPAALYRYDTWSDGWQSCGALNNSGPGMALWVERARDHVVIANGGGTTTIQFYNGATGITGGPNPNYLSNGSGSPGAAPANVTPVLPVAANAGASFFKMDDFLCPAVYESTTLGVQSTYYTHTASAHYVDNYTALYSASPTLNIGPGLLGLQLRYTSGANAGLARMITQINDGTNFNAARYRGAAYYQIQTVAFPQAGAAGDAFVIEFPQGLTAQAGTTTTITLNAAHNTGATWQSNIMSAVDIVITAGTGAGQRRRIASYATGTGVATLAAAVSGAVRTGPWTTAPDSTSVYRIVPSADWVYYQPGGNTTSLYRIDTAATSPAWSANVASLTSQGAGGGVQWLATCAPFLFSTFSGRGTGNLERWSLGNVSSSGLSGYSSTAFPDTLTTGASQTVVSNHKMMVMKEGSRNTYVVDAHFGLTEPGPMLPYATPSALDGTHVVGATSPSGVPFLYYLRPGGQEFYRIAAEWLL